MKPLYQQKHDRYYNTQDAMDLFQEAQTMLWEFFNRQHNRGYDVRDVALVVHGAVGCMIHTPFKNGEGANHE